jgi:hypothetical protein
MTCPTVTDELMYLIEHPHGTNADRRSLINLMLSQAYTQGRLDRATETPEQIEVHS